MSDADDQNLHRKVTPYEFDMPGKLWRSIKYAATRMWWGYLFSAITGVAYGYTLQYQPFEHLGMVIFLAVVVAAVGIAVGGTISYINRADFYETIDPGISVTFESDQYWVPPEMMARIADEVVDRFEPYYKDNPDKSPRDVLKGVHVRVTDKRPIAPHYGKEVNGWADLLNWNMEIYGRYVINLGGFGYELTHFLNHDLFPDREEGEDVKWMKREGIWP